MAASRWPLLREELGFPFTLCPRPESRLQSSSPAHNHRPADHSRLKQWLNRFNGVATKNLPSALGWPPRPRSLGRRTQAASLYQRRNRKRTIPTDNAIRAKLSPEPFAFGRLNPKDSPASSVVGAAGSRLRGQGAARALSSTRICGSASPLRRGFPSRLEIIIDPKMNALQSVAAKWPGFSVHAVKSDSRGSSGPSSSATVGCRATASVRAPSMRGQIARAILTCAKPASGHEALFAQAYEGRSKGVSYRGKTALEGELAAGWYYRSRFEKASSAGYLPESRWSA